MDARAGHRATTREELTAIFADTDTIAVVGASQDDRKAAHTIPRYLKDQGYRVLPVNPRGGDILGEQAYRTLEEVPGPVDVVDVFRPPAEAAGVARSAVAAGAKVLWFQPGTDTDEAVQLAVDAGLTVVAGQCMGSLHASLGLGRAGAGA